MAVFHRFDCSDFNIIVSPRISEENRKHQNQTRIAKLIGSSNEGRGCNMHIYYFAGPTCVSKSLNKYDLGGYSMMDDGLREAFDSLPFGFGQGV